MRTEHRTQPYRMTSSSAASEFDGPTMTSALWDAYGPEHGSIRQTGRAVLHDLVAKPALNGQEVEIVGWDGLVQRMVVKLNGDRIKAKPANLRAVGHVDLQPWLGSAEFFGTLPPDVALSVAQNLPAATIASFSVASRALRGALWLQSDAHSLWTRVVADRFGETALEVVRRSWEGRGISLGPTLLRGACALKHVFRDHFEVVSGGVDVAAGGFDVVACPCVRSLRNVGIGAQGAIRRRAGAALERAVQQLCTPVDELSVTLVPGGFLSKHVAMTVTEPPECLWVVSSEERVQVAMDFLYSLHHNLFTEVRRAGVRTLAMPTLCTGGIGIPAHMVAAAALRAARQDFLAHPSDPMRVRVACYEEDHMPLFIVCRQDATETLFPSARSPDWHDG